MTCPVCLNWVELSEVRASSVWHCPHCGSAGRIGDLEYVQGLCDTVRRINQMRVTPQPTRRIVCT